MNFKDRRNLTFRLVLNPHCEDRSKKALSILDGLIDGEEDNLGKSLAFVKDVLFEKEVL